MLRRQEGQGVEKEVEPCGDEIAGMVEKGEGRREFQMRYGLFWQVWSL